MADGVRIYAGTWDGVVVMAVRNGRTEVLSRVFEGAIVGDVAGSLQQPQRVFAGIVRGGVHRTDDAGRHWRQVLEGDIRSLAVDPTDDRVVYAGTDPVHLYRSEDGGDSWREIESLQRLPEETRKKLGESEAGRMADYHDQHFRHLRQDWSFPVPPNKGHVLEIVIHPDDPTLLLLAIEHGGAAVSRDRGETWDDISEGVDYLDIHYVTTLPHSFDKYFLSSARGFYATDDPRQGWTRAENGCTRNYFHDILFLPPVNGGGPTMVIATADGSPGFWPATKGTMKWNHEERGSLAALFKSEDAAQSWQRLGTGGGLPEEMDPMIWSLCNHPLERDGILAGVGESSFVPLAARECGQGSVMASADRGETWQTLQTGLSAVEHLYAAVD